MIFVAYAICNLGMLKKYGQRLDSVAEDLEVLVHTMYLDCQVVLTEDNMKRLSDVNNNDILVKNLGSSSKATNFIQRHRQTYSLSKLGQLQTTSNQCSLKGAQVSEKKYKGSIFLLRPF